MKLNVNGEKITLDKTVVPKETLRAIRTQRIKTQAKRQGTFIAKVAVVSLIVDLIVHTVL